MTLHSQEIFYFSLSSSWAGSLMLFMALEITQWSWRNRFSIKVWPRVTTNQDFPNSHSKRLITLKVGVRLFSIWSYLRWIRSTHAPTLHLLYSNICILKVRLLYRLLSRLHSTKKETPRLCRWIFWKCDRGHRRVLCIVSMPSKFYIFINPPPPKKERKN